MRPRISERGNVNFRQIRTIVRNDLWTDGRTDGRTDGLTLTDSNRSAERSVGRWTDTPFRKNARTHLKSLK